MKEIRTEDAAGQILWHLGVVSAVELERLMKK